MTRPLLRPLVVLLAALAWATPARAQNLTRATLEGVVREPLGTPLGEATLTLRDPAGGTTLTAATTRDGRFSFVLLLPGEYELLVERFGYASRLLTGIELVPGERRALPVSLGPSAQPVSDIDTLRVASAAAAPRLGVGHRFTAADLAMLPEEHRGLSGLGRLGSTVGAELDFQGLPAALADVAVDGVSLHRGSLLGPSAASARDLSVPLGALQGAELLTNAVDVEWQGGSGLVLNGFTRRGSSTLRTEALASASTGDDGAGRGYQAGVLLGGPIVRDTATFLLGIEAWRIEDPMLAGPALQEFGARVAQAATDALGAPVASPVGAEALRTDRLAGFARVDWQLSTAHSLTLRSTFGGSPRSDDRFALSPQLWRRGRFREGDLSIGLDLASRLSSRLSQEIRVGGSVRNREYEALPLPGAELLGQGLVGTAVVEQGRVVRLDPGVAGEYRETRLHASETLYLNAGAHHWKFGLAAGVRSYAARDVGYPAGEFLFPGVGSFASGRGLFAQMLGGESEVDFDVPSLAAYVQDVWRAAPGLELLVGARFEAEALPTDDLARNEAWLRRTGVDNAALEATRSRFSPRIALLWDVQEAHRWVVSASAGLFSGGADPALLGEALSFDSGVEARRGAGSLGDWPAAPDSAVAPVAGSRLTLLAPGYGAPRTGRASAGLAHHLGERTSVRVGVDYRRTDFLPRRSELNLLAQPAVRDQDGRPVYGGLQQQGELLAPAPGSNRRFTGFESVSALNADGWSTYRGVTVGAEHRGSAVTLFGSYTRSTTRDNWPAALTLLPFPESAAVDAWEEGPSDLDVPERGVAGFHARFPWASAVRVGALYRFRSGYPFTPALGAGVDANADGVAGNDPAFVSADVAGTDARVAAHPCLSASLGAFAGRNSCRAPAQHTVDLRVSLRLPGDLSLVVDGLNLTGSRLVVPDPVLYLVDPAGSLTTAAGRVTVPLRVNESFGEPLYRIGGGRTLRVGLRVSY